jgi:hypothetical protein
MTSYFSADAGDAADPAPEASLDASTGACGDGLVQVGEYNTWSGKVNVHRAPGGSWPLDTDCSSGSGVNTVA